MREDPRALLGLSSPIWLLNESVGDDGGSERRRGEERRMERGREGGNWKRRGSGGEEMRKLIAVYLSNTSQREHTPAVAL